MQTSLFSPAENQRDDKEKTVGAEEETQKHRGTCRSTPLSLPSDLLAGQAKPHPMSKTCDFPTLLALAVPLTCTTCVIGKPSTAAIRYKADILIRPPVQPLTPGLRLIQQEEKLWMDPTTQTTASRGDSCNIGPGEFHLLVFLWFILKKSELPSQRNGLEEMGQNGDDSGNCGDTVYKGIERLSANM